MVDFSTHRQALKALISCAVVYCDGGKLKEAETIYQALVNNNVMMPAALIGLANVFLYKGEYDRCIELMASLLSDDGNVSHGEATEEEHNLMLALLSVAFRKKGMNNQAELYLQKISNQAFAEGFKDV